MNLHKQDHPKDQSLFILRCYIGLWVSLSVYIEYPYRYVPFVETPVDSKYRASWMSTIGAQIQIFGGNHPWNPHGNISAVFDCLKLIFCACFQHNIIQTSIMWNNKYYSNNLSSSSYAWYWGFREELENLLTLKLLRTHLKLNAQSRRWIFSGFKVIPPQSYVHIFLQVTLSTRFTAGQNSGCEVKVSYSTKMNNGRWPLGGTIWNRVFHINLRLLRMT